MELFLAPPPDSSCFLPWDSVSQDMVTAVREVTTKETFWENLSNHFAEENHAEVTTQDNISCVKSICK